MKRLTGRRDGRAYIVGCPEFALPKIAGLIIQQTVNRLAAIEDVLGDEYDLDRLRELVQADREGRCVVLPVKSGTTVYYLGAGMCKWRELDKCDEYCDGWQYEDCYEGERAVREKKFSISDLPCIGKTVFLTREEATAALRREQDVGLFQL